MEVEREHSEETINETRRIVKAHPIILALVYGEEPISTPKLVQIAEQRHGIPEDVARLALYTIPRKLIEWDEDYNWRMREKHQPFQFARLFHRMADEARIPRP